jgi:hypothetical protein
MSTLKEVLSFLTEAYADGDLETVETINNVSYGYKIDLTKKLTNKQNNDKSNTA